MSDFDENDDKDPFAKRGLSDWVKKTLGSNLGAESILSILSQADKTKKDLMHVLSRELRGFLDTIEINDILAKLLSNATLEVSARIRLVPSKEGGLQVKAERVARESEAAPKKPKARAKPKRKAKPQD